MNKVILTFLLLICLGFSANLQAQSEGGTFTIIITSPQPLGGMDYAFKWIKMNLEYPKEAKKNDIKGRVMLQFMVETDSTVGEIKVLRGLGHGCDEEAIRLVNQMRFTPGKSRGKTTRQKMALPISFSGKSQKNEAYKGVSLRGMGYKEGAVRTEAIKE
jgi:TonB family protein